ncbi:MAG: hypothetical protein WCL14_13555 [Bacteroidota bacterium]
MKVEHLWNHLAALAIAACGEALAAPLKLYFVAIFNVIGHLPPTNQADLLAACSRVRNAYNNRKADPTELENAVAALIKILNDLAEFVDFIAKGDKAKIESSGFTATSGEHHEAVIPVKSANPKAKSVESVLDLTVDTVLGAKFYVWFIFMNGAFDIPIVDGRFVLPANNTGVQIIPKGGHHEKVAGLAKGVHAFVGVMAGNAAGLAPMSAIVDAWTT